MVSKYPAARVTAVDQSADALALAADNAQALGMAERLCLLASDWFSAVPAGERFDLIVANPPYLTAAEVDEAAPEVREHEPRSALVAAEEGRADLEKILREAKNFLAAGGLLACETGIAQHARLAAVATQCGYARTESVRDLTGRDRYLLAFVQGDR